MNKHQSLLNKVIIVTGGTGILGNAFIHAIAQAGGTVGVLGRNLSVAEERTNEIINDGGKAVALQADVTNENDLNKAKKLMLDQYGRIDGLVNAAGGNMPGGVVQPNDDLFSMDIGGMKAVLDLNLWGTILPTQIFGEAIGKWGGSIVNISSMSAQRAVTRVLGYSMGKAAVDCYTKWFAIELANRYQDKVRINAIAPGFFLTEQNRTLLTTEAGGFTARGQAVITQTPFKRFGNPGELTSALVWLLSDSSSFVTGTTINIDGGFSAFSGV